MKLTFLTVLLPILIFTKQTIIVNLTYAQSPNSVIDATVKTSVCGDGIIEGDEDCEGDDLAGHTCESLGFLGGELSCDDDCSFDISGCIQPTPTLFPPATTAPTPLTTETPAKEDTAKTQDEPVVSEDQSFVERVVDTITSFLQPSDTTETDQDLPEQKTDQDVPALVKKFDTQGTGKISINNLYDALAYWLRDWRDIISLTMRLTAEEREQKLSTIVADKNCDLNKDGRCDLRDFSILLYHVEHQPTQ